MEETYTLTEAKAKFSELISRVHFGKERFTITRKGKAVAIVLPINETVSEGHEEGLIQAKGALQDLDAEMDELLETIYRHRENAKDRGVDI
ncbi:MAG: type II toxin-antitoxin system Phd/YefM family antitoxin [Deltaproteobacteria bacterium]|nr:type II toxin-antitoxin system Phd/YefM family antitoxin [Deltaproteobacteria bacterium]